MRTAVAPSQRRLVSGAAVTDVAAAAAAAQTPSRLLVSPRRPPAGSCSTVAVRFPPDLPADVWRRRLRGMRQKSARTNKYTRQVSAPHPGGPAGQTPPPVTHPRPQRVYNFVLGRKKLSRCVLLTR